MTARTFTRIKADEVDHLLANKAVTVLDARDPKSFQEDHIDGATLMTSDTRDTLIMSLPKSTPLFLYCYHGNASQVHAQMFSDFGFREVYDLVGGFEAWRKFLLTPPAAAPAGSGLANWLKTEGFDAADLNGCIANRSTPLMHAARQGRADLVRELIAADVELNARNADGNNALWLAAFSGEPAVIDALVAAGIDLDNLNDNGASCLMYAASAGKTDVVARLLAAGANPRLKSQDDLTALDMAANIECLMLLRRAMPRVAATVEE